MDNNSLPAEQLPENTDVEDMFDDEGNPIPVDEAMSMKSRDL